MVGLWLSGSPLLVSAKWLMVPFQEEKLVVGEAGKDMVEVVVVVVVAVMWAVVVRSGGFQANDSSGVKGLWPWWPDDSGALRDLVSSLIGRNFWTGLSVVSSGDHKVGVSLDSDSSLSLRLSSNSSSMEGVTRPPGVQDAETI